MSGEISVPGDKSIAHRALMLGALSGGISSVTNLPDGEDVRATARCLAACGVGFERSGNQMTIDARASLASPGTQLDAANSGTTMRLLSGILASQPFESVLVGDASLSRRPMERVAEPLRRMGARVDTRAGFPPLVIRGSGLRGIQYSPQVASAQVKSAVLLAGLSAAGETTVCEATPSRDHTERMLAATGVKVLRRDNAVGVVGGVRPHPFQMTVPGDMSAAAFFLVGAAVTGGRVTVRGVGINPTRSGILRVLERMGARVEMGEQRDEMGEPVADVTVAGPVTRPIELGAADIPATIDEIPLVALLATQVPGCSIICGAGELRAKESDRISATAGVLAALGAKIRELPDGWTIEGGSNLVGAAVASAGDHRIAMMAAVAGMVASGETLVHGAEVCAISYPGFAAALTSLGGKIDAG